MTIYKVGTFLGGHSVKIFYGLFLTGDKGSTFMYVT